MKWNKLEYGNWPKGDIVLRFDPNIASRKYIHGYIHKEDKEWFFHYYAGPNVNISIDSFYDIEPHYIKLDDLEMPS